MKKILAGIALILALTPVMVQPDAVDDLGRALANIAGLDTVGIEDQPVERLLPGTPGYNAMLKERIRRIREAVDHNELKTPEEARDALVSYLVTQFIQTFTPLANSIAGVVETYFDDKNNSTATAIRRFPGAFGEGIFLLYYLITKMVTPTAVRQKYIGHLIKIRDAVKCLLAKETERAALKDSNGNLICAYLPTYQDAFKQMLGNVKEFIMPIAQTMALGINTPEGKIEGLVVQGTNIILPKFTKDAQVVIQLIEMILNLSEQLKQGLDASAPKAA